MVIIDLVLVFFSGEVRYHSGTMHSFYYDNGDNGTEVDTCAMMIKNGDVGIGNDKSKRKITRYWVINDCWK